jgi:hypothetical protein
MISSSKNTASISPEIPFEIEFTKGLSPEERKRVIEMLSALGFKLVSRSEIVATLKADRKTIERVFKTRITSQETEVRGGMRGPIKAIRLSFTQPPQVPAPMRLFVRNVRFSPPIIPLM